MAQDPSGFRIEILAAGRWLRLERLSFRDARGAARAWEAANRVGASGGAAVAAVLRPSGRLVVVRQFRPPAGGYTLELPAGLLDPGEDAARTAERELREETGYAGRVLHASEQAFSTPGMTGETNAIVIMDVDELALGNAEPVPESEPGEDIEVFLVPLGELEAFLSARRESHGDRPDVKLAMLALAPRVLGLSTGGPCAPGGGERGPDSPSRA